MTETASLRTDGACIGSFVDLDGLRAFNYGTIKGLGSCEPNHGDWLGWQWLGQTDKVEVSANLSVAFR
jgi:hypothetical protein